MNHQTFRNELGSLLLTIYLALPECLVGLVQCLCQRFGISSPDLVFCVHVIIVGAIFGESCVKQ